MEGLEDLTIVTGVKMVDKTSEGGYSWDQAHEGQNKIIWIPN